MRMAARTLASRFSIPLVTNNQLGKGGALAWVMWLGFCRPIGRRPPEGGRFGPAPISPSSSDIGYCYFPIENRHVPQT